MRYIWLVVSIIATIAECKKWDSLRGKRTLYMEEDGRDKRDLGVELSFWNGELYEPDMEKDIDEIANSEGKGVDGKGIVEVETQAPITSRPSNSPSDPPSPAPSNSPSSIPSEPPSPSPSDLPSSSPSDPPSPSPSDPPTSFPSNPPSPSPSALPSHSPSDSPSALPSKSPSDSPSNPPSPSPSALPSSSPSDQPSHSPTDPLSCSIDVGITCATRDETDCSDIQPPPFKCNTNGCVDTISFTYIGPSISSRVVCANQSNDILVDKVVGVDETFTISSLTELIKCEMFRTSDNTKTNEVEINTCHGLFLTNVYGDSLRLESCDENSCMVQIMYEYFITNTGEAEVDVTELVRDRKGSVENLIALVEEKNLDSQESTTATEEYDLDTCVDGETSTSIRAQAECSNGDAVQDDATHVIDVVVTAAPSYAPSSHPTTSHPTAAPVVPWGKGRLSSEGKGFGFGFGGASSGGWSRISVSNMLGERQRGSTFGGGKGLGWRRKLHVDEREE